MAATAVKVNNVPGGRLGQIACASATACFGVGESQNAAAVWRIVDGAAGPPRSLGVPNPSAWGIGCQSPSRCVAVATRDFVEQFVVPLVDGVPGTPNRWPELADAGMSDALGDVACTPTACFAVGRRRTASNADEGIVATVTGGVPGPIEGVAGTSSLSAIACPSAHRCLAVGSGAAGSAVVRIDDGHPGAAHFTTAVSLRDVACSSPDVCIAVGSRGTGPSPAEGQGLFVPIRDGAPGSPVDLAGVSRPGAVACPGSTCVTNGLARGVADAVRLVSIRDGAVVATEDVDVGPNGDRSFGIACPSPTTCLGANFTSIVTFTPPGATTAGAAAVGGGSSAGAGATGGAGGQHHRAALPASLRRPSDVSTRAGDLARSLVGALLLILLVFPAELFNSTLEEHYDEVRRWLHLPERKAPVSTASRRGSPVSRALVFAGVALATAALATQLDPHAGLDRATLALFVGAAVATVAVTLVHGASSGVYARRVTGEAGWLRAYPLALLVAGGCVAVSRLAQFEPGYLYGIVGGFAASGTLTKRDAGRSALIATITTIALAALAWLAIGAVATAAAKPGAGFPTLVADAVLASATVGALGGLIFSLVPLRFMPGNSVWKWSKGAWVVAMALAGFGYVHVVLAPAKGYRGSLVTAVALFVGFGAVSVAFWGYFRLRTEPTPQPAAVPFPIPEYDTARARDILPLLSGLDRAQLLEVRAAERAGAKRKTVLDAIGQHLRARSRDA